MRQNVKVLVMGMGYIGLPTAVIAAKSGVRVKGVDINPEIIETLNRGEIQNLTENLVRSGLKA